MRCISSTSEVPWGMALDEAIIAYNRAQERGDRAICELLAAEIDRGLPKAENKIWHRHPVWFLDGNPIAGYSKLKGSVRLLFWSGQSFDEPGLAPEGTFEAAEARYVSVDEVDQKALRRWLKKSKTIQWDYKNIVKRKGKLERLDPAVKNPATAKQALEQKTAARKRPAVANESATERKPRVFTIPFSSVYPLYVEKAEKKGRTRAEVDTVIRWLSGFTKKQLEHIISSGTNLETFFEKAKLNPKAKLITGVVCGVRVEEVPDPLMRKIRYLDKLVDELAKGRKMDAILRK